jgi:hypothetical protein
MFVAAIKNLCVEVTYIRLTTFQHQADMLNIFQQDLSSIVNTSGFHSLQFLASSNKSRLQVPRAVAPTSVASNTQYHLCNIPTLRCGVCNRQW